MVDFTHLFFNHSTCVYFKYCTKDLEILETIRHDPLHQVYVLMETVGRENHKVFNYDDSKEIMWRLREKNIDKTWKISSDQIVKGHTCYT